jgi:hypothetical protein
MKTLSSIAAVVVVMCLSGCVFESFEAPGIFVAPDASMDADDTGGEAEDVGTQDVGSADVGATDAADMSVPDASDVDASDMSIADVGDDAGVDMGCTGVVEPIPDEFGQICESAAPLETPGFNCDPVAQTGCEIGERCAFQLVVDNGTPVGLVKGCQAFDCETAVLEEGEDCTPGACRPGLECNRRVCKRQCEVETSRGCANNQGCVRPGNIWREYGYCEDTCN